MTLKEAVKQGVPKLRRDPWEPWSHIEMFLNPVGKGGHGPWIKVRTLHGLPEDGGGVAEAKDVVDGAIEHVLFFSEFDFDEDVWEPWHAPEEDERCPG